MNRFSILLIENQISITSVIVQATGQYLVDYNLVIARDVAEAISEDRAAHVILLNLKQVADDVSGKLSSLTAAYPNAPIILLHETATENQQQEELLVEALSTYADDYVSLTQAGLLILERRLTGLHQTLQPDQLESEVASDPPLNEFFERALTDTTSQLALQLVGHDNRVRTWNSTAEAFFGVGQAEALGSLLDDLPLPATHLSRLKDILDHARIIGEPFSIASYPLENQPDGPRWIQAYVHPIRKKLSGSVDKQITDVYIVSVDVTALKRLELEYWRQNQELQLLLETNREISEKLELRPTLEKIAEQSKSLLNADNCSIYFLERDNQTLQPILTIGPQAEQLQNMPLTVGQGMIGTVASTGKAIRISFAGTAGNQIYGSTSECTPAKNEHILCAPLTARKGVIGLMLVNRESASPYDEDDLHFFKSLVQQASAAINNTRLFEETQRNLIELEILYEASATISTTLDIQEVLNTLLRQMVHALDVSKGHIASWDAKQNKGAIRAEYSREKLFIDPAEPSLLEQPFGLAERPGLSVVIDQQRPVFFQLSNPALDDAERSDMEKQGCLSRLLVPLIVKSETVGLAELCETREERFFTADEIRLVRMLANQAAVTLENAQYLRTMQRTVEEMTALYQVASTLATTQDAQSIISIVLQEYLRVLGLKQGSVITFDFETKYGVVKVNFQDEQPALSPQNRESHGGLEGRQIPLTNNQIYRRLMQTHRPIVIEDAQAERLTAKIAPPIAQAVTNEAWWGGLTALSILVIPLQIRGTTIGAIVAEDTRRRRSFDPWEISLGQAMADQLGIALQNAQLFESEFERRRQAETLREVSFVVGSTYNLNEVLERILDQLGRVVKYDSATIHIIEGKQRRIIAGRGFPEPEKVIGLTFSIELDNNEPGSIAINKRRPIVHGNVSERYTAFRTPEYSDVKSWMGIPLISRDQVIGLISIDRRERDAYNEEDVQLAMAFANQVAIALENARLYEIEVRELERELEIAQGIQKTLLPQTIPQVSGLQICGRSIPARQIGGDFFHFFSFGKDRLGVAIGDVSGKGVPAALYMAAAITAIDTKVREELTPSELLNHLNQTLYNRLQENKMNIGLQITTFAPLTPTEANHTDEKEARGSVVTIANAGMIAPIGATQHGCRFLPVSGLPVGSVPAPDQIYQEDLFLLDPYTTIIFSSDGIVEAQNEQGELFGFDRLEETINGIVHTRDATIIADYIINTARTFMGKAEQGDDMTVVVVVKT